MAAAKVFINDDLTKGMPWATEYYLRYPDHIVTNDATMRRSKVVPFSPFHFVDLVKSMDVHCQPGDDVILVCHGMPSTLGIYPKAGSTSWTDRFFVNGIVNDFSKMTDILGLSYDEADKLSDGLFKLRAKRLNHIAIQACRIGQSTDFLRGFAHIFGAKSVSAPTLRTVYGNCEVYMANDEQKKKFRVEYPSFFNVPVSGGGVLTMASKTLGRTILDVVILTDSLTTLLRFLSDNFPTMPNLGTLDKSSLRNYGEMMAGISKPKLLPYHGLLASKSPLKLYFPKDPRYAAAMTYVTAR